ncbi:MAG: tripeptidyl-peptidase-2 [Myxococcota bacterium]
MDMALDQALKQYPLLAASVSAGNEGPGLSTVGTPAASALCTAVAAMLPKESGETLFGAKLKRDEVFSFSSRGGELAKPDVLAPGVASSSVPHFDDGDIKGGTSMAAPQIAGVYALMASAAVAQKTRFTGGTLKRALLHSSRQIAGYGTETQGAGVPDVQRAVNALTKLAKHKEPFIVAGYRVTTDVPTSVSGQGRAAYWRAGTYLPDEDGHEFMIEPIFWDHIGEAERAEFQTVLKFKGLDGWASPDRGSGRLKGEDAISVDVTYKNGAVTAPGVHSARISVVPDDGGGIAAAWLWTTVVTPYIFDRSNSYRLELKGSLEPAHVRRIPILVPPGATSLNINVSTPSGKFGATSLSLFDPNGHPARVDRYRASSKTSSHARAHITGDALAPGTWEAVLYGSFRNKRDTHYKATVAFRGVTASPIRRYISAPGTEGSGKFTVVNQYDTRFKGPVNGTLSGWRKVRRAKVEGDAWEHNYTMNDEVKRIDLVLRMSSKTYNRFTDIAVNVLNDAGEAIVKEGFVSGVCRLSIPKDGITGYSLQVKGAMARTSEEPWSMDVEETFVWSRPIGVMVSPDVTLYPNVRETLTFTLDKTPPKAPRGYVNHGEITFRDTQSGQIWLEVPMALE